MLSPATTMKTIVNAVIIMPAQPRPVALHQIVDFEARKIGGRIGRNPHRLRLARLFQQRAHLPGVGPVVGARPLRDPRLDPGCEAVGQDEMLSCRHAAEDFAQLVGAVAREIDGLGETAGKSRIGVDEAPHLVGVTGDDHHDAVAVVLHEFQQRVDRLPAEIPARSRRARQRIGLVDEENSIERLVAFLQHLGRGLADETGHHVGALDLDQMADPQRPQRAIDVAERARDLGLADAGRPGEDHVQAQRRGGQALRAALLLHLQPCDQAIDLTFDRDQAHHGLEILDRLVGRLIRNVPHRREHHLEGAGQPAALRRLQRAGSSVGRRNAGDEQADAGKHQHDDDAAQDRLGRRRKVP